MNIEKIAKGLKKALPDLFSGFGLQRPLLKWFSRPVTKTFETARLSFCLPHALSHKGSKT